MKFVLKLNLEKYSNSSGFVLTGHDREFGEQLYIDEKTSPVEKYEKNNSEIIIIGDLVTEHQSERGYELFYDAIVANTVYCFGGFFYLIFLDRKGACVRVYSSLFNILPVYYYSDDIHVTISSSMNSIIEFNQDRKFYPDKQYLLERILFNYGLFNRTYIKNINIVGSCKYLELTANGVKEESYLDIPSLFSGNYRKGSKVLDSLADLFIHNTRKYLPEECYAVSFTGGFDGRSLLATSRYHNKRFIAYAFGSGDSQDLLLPMEQAEHLSIDFFPIMLNESFAKDESYRCGVDMVMKSEGNASFSRAHYVYAAKMLSNKVRCIISGNFGSELFRAMHNPGVMISPVLIRYFGSDREQQWMNALQNAPSLNYLKRSAFNNVLDGLIEEMKEYKIKYKGLRRNELFYVYVMGEIFRKYFGPEIHMQSYFISNRAPYLDIVFIRELFQSYYCGVYSDYFTHNPVKRYKGQLVYPHIIKKAFPDLLEFKTEKGYSPKSLLSQKGKIELLLNLLKKRKSKKNNQSSDPFAVKQAFRYNRESWLTIPVLDEYYNRDVIINATRNEQLDSGLLANVLSANYYLSIMRAA